MLSFRLKLRARHLVGGLVAVLLALLVLLPRNAYADEYSIDSVNIEATVSPDGSLSVIESRTFDFDGSFHGVYWKIPTGSYDGRTIETTITDVGEMVDGSYVPFTEAYLGDEHTYQLRDQGSYIEVKLYSAHEYEDATFVIGYTNTNHAARYDDVSTLYWKFVSDGWDVESRNVTCTVHLPVPEGRRVEPEENVRAWGHGPLDAVVSFVDDDVVYRVPGVGTSEFAEARITFPADWLSEATSRGGKVLPGILEEEQRWADQANARRGRARVMSYGGSAVAVLGTLVALVVPLLSLIRYRRANKPIFDDEYFRDVPTQDHPAVLGALYRGGSPEGEDFTASLMRLTDLGAIDLELVTLQSKSLLGRVKTREDYRMTLSDRVDRLRAEGKLTAIDNRALLMVFDDIERFAHSNVDGQDQRAQVYFSDFEKVAKEYPSQYNSAYEGWKGIVESEAARRHFFKSDQPTGFGPSIACFVAGVVLFIATVFLLIMEWLPWYVGVPLILLQVGTCFLSMGIALSLKSYSREAVEIRAKLEALRRWLKDFTRLNEAVPRDVVLWNRLLVMAVVLGVADEVIEQLKTTMPEVLRDPQMMPTYAWYYGSTASRPYRGISNSVSSAHHVSTAALASSSSSSGGGGGGGFSGGGGGGFGGGGGGGAF